jgi:hypothetical protein
MLRAKRTFFTSDKRIRKGDLVADDDPVVKGREALFESVDVPAPQPPKPARKAPAKKTTG